MFFITYIVKNASSQVSSKFGVYKGPGEKIIDFPPLWKHYKLKVLDEYITTLVWVSSNLVPFFDVKFRNI